MEISDLLIHKTINEVCDMFFHADKSNERLFVQRMYSKGIGRYLKRLDRMEFKNYGNVLDAGCGYGQWAIALSMMNEKVIACDTDKNRLEFLENVIRMLDIKNIKLELNGVDQRRYPKHHFDAIFCYSVLYKTKWRIALDNFYYSLKPGGLFYVCSNGLGWYFYNYDNQHNPASDFDPRRHALGSIQKTLDYFSGVREQNPNFYDLILPSKRIDEILKSKFSILYIGSEGGSNINSSLFGELPQPFFIGEYRGVEAVYEILARKNLI